MKLKPLKYSTCVTLDENVLKQIKYLAEKDDRSVSSYINFVLKQHIKTCFLKNKENSL